MTFGDALLVLAPVIAMAALSFGGWSVWPRNGATVAAALIADYSG
jgi:hypothetical protein